MTTMVTVVYLMVLWWQKESDASLLATPGGSRLGLTVLAVVVVVIVVVVAVAVVVMAV